MVSLSKLCGRVDRRAFLIFSLLAGTAATAFAAPVDSSVGMPDDQAEWAQPYITDLGVQRNSVPLLSQETVAATELAYQHYQQIIANGGWKSLPGGQTLKLGSKGPAVVALRRRLMVTDDMESAAGDSPVFDSFVEAGVKRFQARHGLGATGIVGPETLAAMNVPAEVREKQLEINLVRLRSFAGNLGPRFVTANIPAAFVETVENNVVYTHHTAGVGKIDRQSPVMQTKAVEINFNPFWTVPASVIRKDLIPKMQKDPNYLTDNHIRIYNKEGQEIRSTQINWNSLDATNYKFRQDTGGDFNSLGVVRINIANPYGVYMHDTPSKGIFGDDFRFVSSGCIRVQNVRDYVTWLLKDTPGWDRAHIDEAIRSGQRIDAKLAQPVPVYWVYITAWGQPDGLIQFRDDIYERDGFGPGPSSTPVPASPQAIVQDGQGYNGEGDDSQQ